MYAVFPLPSVEYGREFLRQRFPDEFPQWEKTAHDFPEGTHINSDTFNQLVLSGLGKVISGDHKAWYLLRDLVETNPRGRYEVQAWIDEVIFLPLLRAKVRWK